MKQEHRQANADKTTAKPQPVPVPDMQALEAARRKLAAAIKKKAEPKRVQAIPASAEGQRVDHSPYRKESRQ